jgi:hypothetical protein
MGEIFADVARCVAPAAVQVDADSLPKSNKWLSAVSSAGVLARCLL